VIHPAVEATVALGTHRGICRADVGGVGERMPDRPEVIAREDIIKTMNVKT